MPLLSTLANTAKLTLPTSVTDIDITGITADSRQVKPGYVFVAVPGVKADGAQFIEDAKARGAAYVVNDTANPRLALSRLAAAFYSKQPDHMVAVTGTDGKTSTAEFFRQLAYKLGHKGASIGTLGTLGEARKELAPGLNTTPDPVALHAMLSQLASNGYTHAAMEASSHGLHQYRLHGVHLKAAAFTNLTRDHLDYHGDVESYFAAKEKLFAEFSLETAVLNVDDARYERLAELCKKRGINVISYGMGPSDLHIEKIVPQAEGLSVSLVAYEKPYAFDLPLYGAFQVYNMLAAAGLMLACGEELTRIMPLLMQLEGVPGRLEKVGEHASGAPVFVDYAHTPAALANVLKTLRPHTKGKLAVVFGCGGDRDKGKRPEMGKAAAEAADVVIVTDDNPRTEDAAQIRAEVLVGCPGAKAIADRRQAIYGAVQALSRGDVLLVAGKGHETSQIIGTVAHAFSDAAVIREALGAVE